MDRKKFLLVSFSSLASIPVFGLVKKKEGNRCITQADALGPYFRRNVPLNNRMTTLDGGRVLRISGIVYDGEDCQEKKTLSGSTIDVWHAGTDGNYDNSSKDFLFRTKINTDSSGRYSFTTILPGKYGSRPRHIHYKIESGGYETLVTQLYFEGAEHGSDYLSRKASTDRFIELKANDGTLEGTFDIYMQKK
ncbi:hypothetical protein [uncultured Croceitalea sp.]|uniref:dioxygenase family protein n=1 Tax=uncultured Croceitalea sp. TaxID=1798908 RepID=UPI003306470C